jgi:hypothetical protein
LFFKFYIITNSKTIALKKFRLKRKLYKDIELQNEKRKNSIKIKVLEDTMKSKTIQTMLLLGLAFIFTFSLTYSQVAYQPVGIKGGIDYGQRVIVTKGMGQPGGIGGRGGQIRAAILDAQRNFLEVTKGAYVTSTTTVEGLITTGDVIQSHVEGLVQNYSVVDTSYWEDGTIEVTLNFDMSGSFLNEVLPKTMGIGTPPSYSVPSGGGGVYTGLIVDARGLGVRPALAPKILDTQNKEVYGSSYVSREYAIQQGIVGYDKDPVKAQTNDRVAPSPLFVKGIQVVGPNKTDVVISDQDAARLLALSENLNFMRCCRVIILVD